MTTSFVHEILLTHRVSMAHRLSSPGAPPLCQSIHGHTWTFTVTLAGQTLDEDAMLLEFGRFKKVWRGWLDNTLDHALVIASTDPLAERLAGFEPAQRLVLFEGQPTTEALAAWAFRETEALLLGLPVKVPIALVEMHLQETPVNAARYRRIPG